MPKKDTKYSGIYIFVAYLGFTQNCAS